MGGELPRLGRVGIWIMLTVGIASLLVATPTVFKALALGEGLIKITYPPNTTWMAALMGMGIACVMFAVFASLSAALSQRADSTP